ARLIENRTKWGKRYRILDVIEDFSDSLRNELDYLLEGRNGHKMRQIFAEDSKIRVPKIYWDYTTRKILTMEMVHGIKVNQVEQLKAEGYDLPLIADRIAHSLFTQVLYYGFFHGDPHPGNIFIKPGNVITYLDFGLVGRLSDQMKYHFASLIRPVKNNSPDEMRESFEDRDVLDYVEDMKYLHHDLDRSFGNYYDACLPEISLGQLLIDIFAIAYRYRVDVPTDITVLAKAILTAEEIIVLLEPNFSIMKAVEPFAENIMKERFHPKRLLRRALE